MMDYDTEIERRYHPENFEPLCPEEEEDNLDKDTLDKTPGETYNISNG